MMAVQFYYIRSDWLLLRPAICANSFFRLQRLICDVIFQFKSFKNSLVKFFSR